MKLETNRDTVQEEALNEALKHERCGLAISMGVGKTRIALNHIIKNYNSLLNVLVVVPKKSVMQSWLDEMDKMKLRLEDHITFVTYLSLNKKNPEDYDIVYLDECHSLLKSHLKFLNRFNGQILGLTGTPPENTNSEKYYMVNKFCPMVYKFSVDDATNSKILNDYKIVVHYLNLSSSKNKKQKKRDGSFWMTSEQDNYNYYTRKVAEAQNSKSKSFASIMRMRALMDYKTKETYTKNLIKSIDLKCIIFANTQAQADRICKHSFHSTNPSSVENLELFSDGRVDKLSCVLQLSEGVTIPNLEEGIIMHSYGNERKASQRIGRLLRLNPEKTATCHILCYKNTVDEQWVENSLKNFDSNKVKHVYKV